VDSGQGPVGSARPQPTSGAPTLSERPARVVIVDDYQLFRAGFRQLLAGEPDIVVAGEASSGREAIDVAARLCPDVIIIDTEMPDVDGIEAMRVIKRRDPSIIIICASTTDGPDRLLEALRAGATGFVSKDTDASELLAILRRARRGDPAVAPALASRLLVRLAMEARIEPVVPDALTEREMDVLQLIAAGNTNREIAGRLIVAVGTVKAHVEHILTKLGAGDRTEAAVRAVELGLVNSALPPGASAARPDAGVRSPRRSP
jgi:DNA-binding NarL/FixJ family response regulator